MPARSLVGLITLFWLATTSWLFYRDVWPQLRPGQPPPYTIDLADETLRTGPPISWEFFRRGEKIGEVQTWLDYREQDDTFELHSKAPSLKLGLIGPFAIRVEGMSGMYRVTRDGQLREIVADIGLALHGLGLLRTMELKATAHIEGEVRNRRFAPQGWVDLGSSRMELPLEPVDVPAQVSVLNPLHPVNRLSGLRKGQHWQVQLLNPLNDSLMAVLKKDPGAEFLLRGHTGVQTLQAEVLPETELLEWRRHPVPCLVIAYQSEDMTARTWVRESDGLVLRQEASYWGDQLVMMRDWKVVMP